jgi:hypothetical protein
LLAVASEAQSARRQSRDKATGNDRCRADSTLTEVVNALINYE